MQVDVVESIAAIEPAQWAALAPASVFLEHGFLAALELSGSLARGGFESRHLCLRDAGRLVAALPCYRKTSTDHDQLPDWAARVASKNDLPYGPTLFVGVPFVRAAGRKLLAEPGLDRRVAMAPLIEAAKQVIADSPSPVIHHYFATADEVDLLEPLGFHRRPSARHAWLNRAYPSFDAFLAELVSARRSMIRSERRKLAAADLRFETLAGEAITDSVMELVRRCHDHTVDKYAREGDCYTPEFFSLLRERMRDRLEVTVVERAGARVAAMVSATGDGALYPLFPGVLEEIPYLMIELVIYDSIEKAIARKLERIDTGGTMEYQVHRGFLPIGLDHSASWIGDEALDAAFAVLVEREREWTPGDVAKKLRQSPFRAQP